MSDSAFTNELMAAGLAWLPASLLGEAVGTAISVLDYGALGDGVHDDTAAIQKAATAVGQAGGTLLFPPGTYLVSSPIAISSDTLVQGSGAGSILTTAAVWHDPGIYGPDPYVIFTNKNYAASPIVDTNIVIESLSFVWTNTQSPGAEHNIRMYAAKDVVVRNCVFNGGGDAIAFIGVLDGLMTGNIAYGNTNCPYDTWGGQQNIRIIGNYASGPFAQAANFNAHAAAGPGPFISSGFTCIGNQFYHTGPGAGAINFDPLTTADTVNNVVVSNNVISAGTIYGRGNVNNVLISGNLLVNMATGTEAIFSYTDGLNVPTNISVVNNTIILPTTISPNLGVIRVSATGFLIDDNTITGSGFSTAAIYTVGGTGIIGLSNNFSGTIAGAGWSSTNHVVQIPNNTAIKIADTAATFSQLLIDGGNNLILNGTDSTGAARTIFAMLQRNSTSGFNIYPGINVGTAQANFIQMNGGASGAADGNGPFIIVNPSSVDTDVALRVLGKGARGTLLGAFTNSGAPSTSLIPANTFALVKDSSGGSVKLYYNDAGSLVSVTLS